MTADNVVDFIRKHDGPFDERYFEGIHELEVPAEDPAPTIASMADYLGAVETYIRRYVAFPSENEPVAVALWVAHAHLVDRFETSPILAVTSPEMGSGKTRVLDCLELLVPNAWRCVIPSEAVTYSVLAQRPRPTMLLDEADAIFGTRQAERYEGLRAVLNSGNRQGTPVYRVNMNGKKREVESFDVFGPKVVAGIGDLPSTVADRSIAIRMKRRSKDEPIEKFRQRDATAAAEHIVFIDGEIGLSIETTAVPDELPDRAADSWEPLLAIADAAGGTWPVRARMAAVALSSDDQRPMSIGQKLLADLRQIFGGRGHLTTHELLAELADLEGSPWPEWYSGKPISAKAVSRLLEPYGITPQQQRVGGEKVRGYFRHSFEDAWRRYVPDVPDVPLVEGARESLGLLEDPA